MPDGWQPGVDPEHRDYYSFADFSDPDGNTWVLQESNRVPGLSRYIRSGASTPIRSSERAITAFVAVTRPSRNAWASEPSTLCSW